MSRRLVALGVPLLVALALCLPRLRGPIDLRYDAGVYYLLGTALAEGKGYRLLNEPGAIEAVQYPPLLPALVAAHQLALGTADPAVVGRALRFTFLAFFLAYVAAAVLLARAWLAEPARADGAAQAGIPPGAAGGPWPMLVGLVTALYLYSYFLSDLLFSELPFALAAVLFFLCEGRARREGSRAAAWGAGLLAAAAYLLRTQGIALLAAWVGAAVLEGRLRRALGRAAVALIPILAWQGYVNAVRAAPEYRQVAYEYQRAPYQFYNVDYSENLALVDPFAPEKGVARLADLAANLGRNLRYLPVSLGEAVSSKRDFWQMQRQNLNRLRVLPWLPRRLEAVALGAIGFLVLAGLAVFALRREWLVPLYALGSAVVICLTPWNTQFPRYLAPLTPFLALALARLFVSLTKGVRWRRWAAPAGVALFAGLIAEQSLTAYQMFKRYHRLAHYTDAAGRERPYRLFFYTPSWQGLEGGMKRLRALPPAERGVVATLAPHWLYLWTGLPAVFPPFEDHPAEAQRLLDGVPVAFAVADDFDFLKVSDDYLEPTLAAFPSLWEPFYAAPDRSIVIDRRAGRGASGRSRGSIPAAAAPSSPAPRAGAATPPPAPPGRPAGS